MNKIIITGITGFIGTNLSRYLLTSNLNYEIIGLGRNTGITYKELSLNLLNTVYAVIHLAGKAHDLKGTVNEQDYDKANYYLTKTIYNLWLKSESKKFIFVSSVKAAADEITDILREDHIPNPKTVYGKSKLKAEKYLLKHKPHTDKKVYILRPCMVYGPNNKGNLNLLIKIINKKVPVPLGAYNNKRSYLSVDNLCFVMENLITKKPKSGIYNIADDTPISTINLVKIIGEALNVKVAILNISPFFINILGKIGDFIPFPINSDRIKKLTKSYVVSNEKIKQALQIKLPIDSIEGIKKVIHKI